MRIANSGPDGLNVTGLDITGPFAVVDAPSLPALVPAGGTLDVKVRFTATSIGTAGGLWNGTLTIKSDDADEPNLPVELAGFWQSQSEGGQEPNLDRARAAVRLRHPDHLARPAAQPERTAQGQR